MVHGTPYLLQFEDVATGIATPKETLGKTIKSKWGKPAKHTSLKGHFQIEIE